MLNKKVYNNKIKYFINRKDFSFYEISWKLVKHFENIKSAIKNFE